MVLLASAIMAMGLALAHAPAGRLRFLDVIPRSRWLSGSSPTFGPGWPRARGP